MRTRTADNRGFTLAEVLVASTISAFIAVVAVGALRAVTGSAQIVDRSTEAAAEMQFAVRLIKRDLANLYRDMDARNMRLIGSSEGTSAGGPPFLRFYMTGCAKARSDQPEGDVYEVEYLLMDRPGEESQDDDPSSILFRRLWPNPDIERDPGGVLTPIVENLGAFEVSFFDGQQWAAEWPEEMQSIPQLIRVTLVGSPPERGDPVAETFIVNFPRMTQAAAPGQEGQTEGQSQPQGESQAQPQAPQETAPPANNSPGPPPSSRSRR